MTDVQTSETNTDTERGRESGGIENRYRRRERGDGKGEGEGRERTREGERQRRERDGGRKGERN